MTRERTPIAWRMSAHRLLLGYVACLMVLLFAFGAPRVTGDGNEYLAVATNLANARPPSLSQSERASFGLSFPELTGVDGRQDVMHFWAYPAVVAPMLRLCHVGGVRPEAAFATVNFLLLALAFGLVARAAPAWLLVVVFAGPIIWWSDKVHSEVFTFSLLAIGLGRRDLPILSFLVLGVAAAQNPPILGIGIFNALAAIRRSAPEGRRRLFGWFSVSIGIAAMHPLYYLWRLGRMSPLADDVRLTGIEPFGYVLWDPNVGMLWNYPAFLAASLVMLLGRKDSSDKAEDILVPVLGMAILLFAFAQTSNLNHGGTPSMSRYALWLLPLLLPVGHRWTPRSLAVRYCAWGVGCAALSWSLVYFRPSVPEAYLEPTRLALYMWTRYPNLHNPLPEIFAERLRHQDMAHLLAATAHCEKVLMSDAVWPSHCAPEPVPARCREGVCYANRTEGGYEFVVTSRRSGLDLGTLRQRLGHR